MDEQSETAQASQKVLTVPPIQQQQQSRRRLVASPTTTGARRQLLHELGVGAIAELLLDRADDPAGHLRILGGSSATALATASAELGLADLLGKERAAPADLEVELRDLLLAALARVDVVDARLLHRLLVRADHVEDQRVIDPRREPLRRPSLHDLGVDHADQVGRLEILP